ncbi:MAG: hypothetical protein WA803_13340 [Steroidobacteraceae bacterium]
MAGFGMSVNVLSIRMKRLLIGSLIFVAGSPAFGQAITLGASPPAVSSKAFNTVAVSDVKAGTYPSQFVLGKNCKSSWSLSTHRFVNGNGIGTGSGGVRFPVFGILNCTGLAPDGFSVYASTTTLLTSIETDKASHVGGYQIESSRSVKAGSVIPTLMFLDQNGGYSILSISPTRTSNDKTDAAASQPWLIISDDHLKPVDKNRVLQAWTESTSSVRSMLAIPGIFK